MRQFMMICCLIRKKLLTGSIHAVTADGFIIAFYAVNIWRMRRSFWIRNAKSGKDKPSRSLHFLILYTKVLSQTSTPLSWNIS